MPMIKIELLAGRSEKMLQELITEVTNATANSLNIQKDSIDIIIKEVEGNRWAKAGKLMNNR